MFSIANMDADIAYREKTAQECWELCRTNPGRNIPQSSSYTATSLPSLKPSKSDEQDTAGKVKTNSLAAFSPGPLHIDEQVLDD